MKYVKKIDSGLTYEKFQSLSQKLEAKGLHRENVGIPPKKLEPNCYYVTSYTGDEKSFEGSLKYNITYLDVE